MSEWLTLSWQRESAFPLRGDEGPRPVPSYRTIASTMIASFPAYVQESLALASILMPLKIRASSCIYIFDLLEVLLCDPL